MSSSAPRKTSTMQQAYSAARAANYDQQQNFQPPLPLETPPYFQAPQPQQNQYQNGYTQAPQPQQRILNTYPQDMRPVQSPQPQQRVLNTYPQDMRPAQSNPVARRNETYSTALVPVASRNSSFAPQSNNQYASAENALVPAANVEPEQQQLLEAVSRAEKVAEEAQSDRPGSVKKSIPPFVQKLAT